MEALFEIFNILKLLHDFINGADGGIGEFLISHGDDLPSIPKQVFTQVYMG